MKVSPYLNYGGNCEQAFRFYEQNLGGKIVAMMKHGEQPGAKDGSSLKDILYAHITFGDTEVMGSDVATERFQPMRSVYL